MIEYNPFGGIKTYVGVGGRPIFYPETVVSDEKTSGGAFFCSPVFGSGQWAKTQLPRHGLIRQLRPGAPGRNVKHRKAYNTDHFTLRFDADNQFPWAHQVKIGLTAISSRKEDLLMCLLGIKSLEPPSEKGRMPLSFGWHPYFATHGGPFMVRTGSRLLATERHDLSRSIEDDNRLVVELTTIHGRVLVDAWGFDYWNICSDDTSKYVCIAPATRSQSLNYFVEELAQITVRYTPHFIPHT